MESATTARIHAYVEHEPIGQMACKCIKSKACRLTRDFLALHALQAREILRRLGPDVSAPPSHSVHDAGIRLKCRYQHSVWWG